MDAALAQCGGVDRAIEVFPRLPIAHRAQRRQVEELQRRSREAILRLHDDSRYPELLDRLVRTARDQLGPDAEVELDPPGLGGVIGRKGRTSVDYTLPALVDRTIASLGDELEVLWR